MLANRHMPSLLIFQVVSVSFELENEFDVMELQTSELKRNSCLLELLPGRAAEVIDRQNKTK